jgi:hypothetical protein
MYWWYKYLRLCEIWGYHGVVDDDDDDDGDDDDDDDDYDDLGCNIVWTWR